MGKKSYTIPEVDIYTMEGIRLLAGFSVDPQGASEVSNTELDANKGYFEEGMPPTKGLWDE